MAGKNLKRVARKATVAKTAEKDTKRCINIVVNEQPGRNVCIAGCFNNWQPEKKLTDKNGDGVYRCQLRLAPGTYQYKLVVDGQWRLDADNPNLAPNEFGSCNNVLVVEEK